jgi:serine/threonine protein kinase
MPLPIDRHARIAQLLGDRYELSELIGEGGFATVYRAKNLRLGRIEALKVLSDQLTEDREFARRFEQEARVAASLDHPSIVKIYDYGVAEDVAWFSMQLIVGQSLARELKAKNQKMEESEVVRLAVPILDALEYSHVRGVVHRDIKPDNIMVDEIRRPYLTDFGIAKGEESLVQTRAGLLMGSPAYMAPEQLRGEPAGERSDLYSLGVTLYRMLTLDFPFKAEDTFRAARRKLEEAPDPLSAKRPDITPELEAVVMKAIAREPADRFANAREMREALEDYLDVFGLRGRGAGRTPPYLTPASVRTPSGRTPQGPTTQPPFSPRTPLPADATVRTPPVLVPDPQKTSPLLPASAREDSPARLSPVSVAEAAVPAAQAPLTEGLVDRPFRIRVGLLVLLVLGLGWIALKSFGGGSRPGSSQGGLDAKQTALPIVQIASPVPTLPEPTAMPMPAPAVVAPARETVPPTATRPAETRPATTRAARTPGLLAERPERQVNLPQRILPTLVPAPAERYCATVEKTSYAQAAAKELPRGFSREQGEVFRGPRTDAARIQLEVSITPREPVDGEPFEIVVKLANGGDIDFSVARVEESAARSAQGFIAVGGLSVPASVSVGGTLAVYRFRGALAGGSTYTKEIRVVDALGDAWQTTVRVRPCLEQ